MKDIIVLHHHEIVLKRNNRLFFERQLLRNVRIALSGFVDPLAVSGGYGRFIIELNGSNNTELIVNRLTYVFGLSNICIGVDVEQNLSSFYDAAAHLLSGKIFSTIRVHTRRSDKNFPLTSMEVNAKVGEYICKQFNVKANLSEPDETIFIEIANRKAYIYLSKIKGAGGLPVGVSGRVVSLMSAGFDSPIASWQMMKRGANVVFVHFHSMPFTSQNSIDQVKQLISVLTRYQFTSKAYFVPFASIQQEIVVQVPQALRIILYRRMMVRIAEKIAQREKAEALVTGEVVGQVASQTLRNIHVIDEVANLPILRPICGIDKEETMAIARKIGTYDISKEPYDDCCSFFLPKNPSTWASIEEIKTVEEKMNIQELVNQTIQNMEVEIFEYCNES